MSFGLIIYILFLLIFFIASGLIFRHTVKFGYLSQRFKTIVTIFGLLALSVIIFSIYIFLQVLTPSSETYSTSSPPTSNSGELNF